MAVADQGNHPGGAGGQAFETKRSGSGASLEVRKIPTTKVACTYLRQGSSRGSTSLTGATIPKNERLLELGNELPLGFATTPANLNLRNNGQPNWISNTKFTALSWLPKSLFYQFQRAANVYFLCIAILVVLGSEDQGVPFPIAVSDYSPLLWPSNVLPFMSVLAWTALKDLLEDLQRRREDKKENTRQTLRYDHRNRTWMDVMWKDVLCGDLLYISCDSTFPADLILLRAAGGHEAFISTANLDGETNLKEKRAPVVFGNVHIEGEHGISRATSDRSALAVTRASATDEEKDALAFTKNIVGGGLSILLSAPEPTISDVKAEVRLGPDKYPGGDVNFLPRGCMLKNTPWVVCVAVYVGDETKTRLNATEASIKSSNMQRHLNRMVRGIVYVLCFFCVYEATLSLMPFVEGNGDAVWPIKWIQFLLKLNWVVPISMYVVFEMMKFILGYKINNDPQMFYPSESEPGKMDGAVARTQDLIEEMGQIDFIFSDKTGTLTANEMVFARCSVGGLDFGDFRDKVPDATGNATASSVLRNTADDRHESLAWFFLSLALCHKVQVDEQLIENVSAKSNPPSNGPAPTKLYYTGMSPDEVALVQAAHNVGIVFKERVRVPGASASDVFIMGPPGQPPRKFQILNEIEFNSDRKRMSVIVRHGPDVHVITKGADNVILNLLTDNVSRETEEHLSKFSHQGLRTLLVASRKIDDNEYHEWAAKLNVAQRSLDSKKDEEVAKVEAMIETNLTLVGVTAVEDKLQDGVPDTLQTLKDASIRVWVLTGDKTETAVDIARSSNLFGESTKLVYVTDADSLKVCTEKLQAAQSGLEGVADGGLVLDGMSVKFALESEECRAAIFKLGLASRSCLCCRLSPMQKRRLVELVRNADPTIITLAIGDGANDVPMIDGAHLGVGIRGKEGNQAVQSSDVAISQFRFLRPLLLCHGRRAYRRVAFFLCYYFYKNVTLAVGDMVWTHLDNMSDQLAFPEYLTAGYNIIFTSMQLIIMLGFDEDVPDAVSNAHPELYVVGPQGRLFHGRTFTKWMMYSLWHGLCMWMVPYLWFNVSPSDYDVDDHTSIFWVSSCTSFFICILLVNLKAYIFAMNYCKFSTWFPMAVFFVLYFPYVGVLGYTSFGIWWQPNLEEVPFKTFSDHRGMLSIIVACSVALFPDILERLYWHFVRPSELTKVRRDWESEKDKYVLADA